MSKHYTVRLKLIKNKSDRGRKKRRGKGEGEGKGEQYFSREVPQNAQTLFT